MRWIDDKTALLDGPGLWMEGDALAQLARVAGEPGCHRAAGMPDLHPGPGIPIGAAFLCDAVVPSLIGGDAGCGVRVVALRGVRDRGDRLERRVRDATDGPALPDADPAALALAAWRGGARAVAAVAGVPDSFAAFLDAAEAPDDASESRFPAHLDPEAYGLGLGTIGGGNHFLELSEVTRVVDRPRAANSGLVPGEVAIVAHSGSRALGKAIASRWPAGALSPDQLPAFLADLDGAVRYARTNRWLLAWRMAVAVGATRPGKVAGALDLVHNTVTCAQGRFLHRKGCAPAELGDLTVVLGSRGAPSAVLEGLGAEAALWSVAHGAGRKLGRNEARDKLKPRYSRSSLTRTALGGRVVCDDPDLLYEEHPDAYKPIDEVVDALCVAGAARRIAELVPLITVKR